MDRVVGHSVLWPRVPGLTLSLGEYGVKHSRSGLVGQLYFRASPLAGFVVWGPGQIASGLSTCDGATETSTVTANGRPVCWNHHQSGYWSVTYSAGGLVYQAYSSDGITHAADSREWALALVDSLT